MNHGFIRTAAASPSLRVADCGYNTRKITEMMDEAVESGTDLVVFPELCITGYTCSDLFFQTRLLDGAIASLAAIVEKSRGMKMLTVVGLPLLYDQKLYNCAAVILDGAVLGVVPKQHLPNYGEFYERRQFTPAEPGNDEIELLGARVPFGTALLFTCGEMPEFVVAAEICEDLWVPRSPSISHALAGATVIVNPSAGDETTGKAEYRRMLVAGQSARLVCGYVYAGAGEGESTTDMVFSGHSLICENGLTLSESELFTTGLICNDLDIGRLCHERRRMTTFMTRRPAEYRVIPFSLVPQSAVFTRHIPQRPFVPQDAADREKRCRSIVGMQAAGLKKRIAHTGCKTAVIGVSGGLDSTLALLVTVRAMDELGRPRTDIEAVTMPCFGTTTRTRSNAETLCRALGVGFRTVDITEAVRQHFRDIGQDPKVYDITFENGQARERTQVLMDIANKTGGIVIGTGDLSELALGWATYNGDHMSMYGVNCSIPKTLVRHLVRYFADTARDGDVARTLLDILDTPVSPELLPHDENEITQKTEDIVGPYELHDFFLYYMVRYGFAPSKIFFLAGKAFAGVYDGETIRKWLAVFVKRFFAQQFKRSCLPDGPKIGSVTLSPRGDWRMPSDAVSVLWLDDIPE